MSPSFDGHRIFPPPSASPGARRGLFAHRRGEQPEDEQQVAEFWQNQGLTVEFLEPKPRELSSRLPDFRLMQDGHPFAYCEVKTVWRHTNHVRVLNEGHTVQEHLEVSGADLEERLTADVVTAIRQLLQANPDHSLLNIVVMVNRDAEATPAHLAKVLNRRLSVKDYDSQYRRTAQLIKEIEQFRVGVDICLWADSAIGKGFSVSSAFVSNPQLAAQVRSWTGLAENKQILLQPAA